MKINEIMSHVKCTGLRQSDALVRNHLLSNVDQKWSLKWFKNYYEFEKK